MTDRQTESDAYEPIVPHAQVSSKLCLKRKKEKKKKEKRKEKKKRKGKWQKKVPF